MPVRYSRLLNVLTMINPARSNLQRNTLFINGQTTVGQQQSWLNNDRYRIQFHDNV